MELLLTVFGWFVLALSILSLATVYRVVSRKRLFMESAKSNALAEMALLKVSVSELTQSLRNHERETDERLAKVETIPTPYLLGRFEEMISKRGMPGSKLPIADNLELGRNLKPRTSEMTEYARALENNRPLH